MKPVPTVRSDPARMDARRSGSGHRARKRRFVVEDPLRWRRWRPPWARHVEPRPANRSCKARKIGGFHRSRRSHLERGPCGRRPMRRRVGRREACADPCRTAAARPERATPAALARATTTPGHVRPILEPRYSPDDARGEAAVVRSTLPRRSAVDRTNARFPSNITCPRRCRRSHGRLQQSVRPGAAPTVIIGHGPLRIIRNASQISRLAPLCADERPAPSGLFRSNRCRQ
jgi:hypothetical protein